MTAQGDLDYIVQRLRAEGWGIAFAESCTGGRLAADLTTVPGSSDVVAGSAVCYQMNAKHDVLGLDDVTEATVVSSRTALRMAQAARRVFKTDMAVGTTGWLDGEHDGQAPHAYWALDLSGVWPPRGSVGARVDFAEGATRAQNRERLLSEIFAALRTFFEEESGG